MSYLLVDEACVLFSHTNQLDECQKNWRSPKNHNNPSIHQSEV